MTPSTSLDPLVVRLQRDEEAPGVLRVAGRRAERGTDVIDIRVLGDNIGERLLPANHLFIGDVLRGIRHRVQDAGVLNREKALRDR